MTEIRTVKQEESNNPKTYFFMCIFKDFATNKYGLNISTEIEIFTLLFDINPTMTLGLGGALDNERISALRDFLTDVLRKRKCEITPNE